MPNDKISNFDRERIIDFIENMNKSVKSAAGVFQCKRGTISRILKIYRDTGRRSKLTAGGKKKKKLTSEQIEMICSWVDEDCQITLAQLKQRAWSTFEVSICEKPLDKVLKEFHFSFKRVGFIPEKRNEESTLILRQQFANWMIGLLSSESHEKNFFLDETGFQCSMRSKYGRSALNTLPTKTISRVKTKNDSLSAVMGKYGLFFYELQNKPYNIILMITKILLKIF